MHFLIFKGDFLLRGAERIWPPSGARAGAMADGARRSQMARAWPRAAQHKLMTRSNKCFNRIDT